MEPKALHRIQSLEIQMRRIQRELASEKERLAKRREYDHQYRIRNRERLATQQAARRIAEPIIRRCVVCGIVVGRYKRYCDNCKKY